MKFIAGLLVWVKRGIGSTPQVFLTLRVLQRVASTFPPLIVSTVSCAGSAGVRDRRPFCDTNLSMFPAEVPEERDASNEVSGFRRVMNQCSMATRWGWPPVKSSARARVRATDATPGD